MPLKYKEGDILEAKTQVIVNPVNCKGIMGKGLALQFKKKYPAMYKEYKQECAEGKVTIGTLQLYKKAPKHWILNFPTKNHWRQKSKLEYIEKGLVAFKEKYEEWGITSIAFPRLGCQQGGLDWAEVKPLMEKYLADLPNLTVQIFTYKPSTQKPTRKAKRTKKSLKTETREEKQQTLANFHKTKL